MKNLNETYEKCKAILDDLWIDYDVNTPISVNNRLTRAYGRTKWRVAEYDWKGNPIYKFKIEINPAMLLDSVPQKELEDTVLHELLHTVEGCQNHGAKWKSLAMKVNKAYGYKISRTSYVPECAARREKRNPVKYICACEKCGVEWKYKRWGKVCENPKRYTHTGCGGHLYMKWHDPKIQILGLNPKFN